MKQSTGTTSTVTDLLGALSEPIRLRIVRILEREELSVGEVARVVQLPQSTVSRHLKTLASVGWLSKRTEGTATLYRLAADDLSEPARSLWRVVREQIGQSSELAEDDRRLASVVMDRRADSQAFFGRVAGQWDSVRDELFGTAFTYEALLALLPSGWTVADIGCGTGNVSELLAPYVERVIAVDQSGAMLDAAKRRLEAFGNVTFKRGGIEKLPLKDGSVDAATVSLVLHHLEKPEAALEELHRVIRAGGQVWVVDMLEHDRSSYKHTMGHCWLGFSRGQIEEMMGRAGFEDARVVMLPSDSEARGPSLFVCTARKASA